MNYLIDILYFILILFLLMNNDNKIKFFINHLIWKLLIHLKNHTKIF